MYASFGRDCRLSCQHITSLLFRRDGCKGWTHKYCIPEILVVQYPKGRVFMDEITLKI